MINSAKILQVANLITADPDVFNEDIDVEKVEEKFEIHEKGRGPSQKSKPEDPSKKKKNASLDKLEGAKQTKSSPYLK